MRALRCGGGQRPRSGEQKPFDKAMWHVGLNDQPFPQPFHLLELTPLCALPYIAALCLKCPRIPSKPSSASPVCSHLNLCSSLCLCSALPSRKPPGGPCCCCCCCCCPCCCSALALALCMCAPHDGQQMTPWAAKRGEECGTQQQEGGTQQQPEQMHIWQHLGRPHGMRSPYSRLTGGASCQQDLPPSYPPPPLVYLLATSHSGLHSTSRRRRGRAAAAGGRRQGVRSRGSVTVRMHLGGRGGSAEGGID